MSTDHKPFNGHTPEETARNEAKIKFYTQQWDKEEDRQLFSELNAVAEREQAAYVEGAMSREAELSSLRETVGLLVRALQDEYHHAVALKSGLEPRNGIEVEKQTFAALSHVKSTHPNL